MSLAIAVPSGPARCLLLALLALALAVALPLASAALPAADPTPVTLRSLLAEMTDPDAIARWPEPAFSCRQASSYDRRRTTPGNADWFANNDHSHYVRDEVADGRVRHVLLDVDGPGAIVRFWLTTNQVKAGRLCITLDGARQPTFTFPAFDLLSGGVDAGSPWITAHPGYSRTGVGGNTMYLPVPYARHCTVTWEDADPAKRGPRYYQINYRTYAPGTAVESITAEILAAAHGELEGLGRILEAPAATIAGRTVSLERTLEGGSEATLDLPAGPAAVRRCALKVEGLDPATAEQTLRGLVLRMACDGEDTIWCPASDFSGSGVGLNPLQSWYRSVYADGTMVCRWTMPYRSHARITLHQLGTVRLTVALRATVGDWSWDERSLHFHVAWHQQAGLRTPPYSDWNYVTIAGKGVYVGDALALFNPVATWYGEGDEKIWVDSESFPSHVGTGTEDYYNYSWAPKPTFHTPFANHVRMDQRMTQGWNAMSRTRALDGIPFTIAFRFDMELMSWKPTTLTYAATTYWYALPGATTTQQPAPEEALRTIATISALPGAKRFPGACEFESLAGIAPTGGATTQVQDMAPWDTTRWSGGAQLLIRSGKPGDAIECPIPAADAAAKRLILHATRAPDYGIIRFSINGTPVAAAFDGFAAQVGPSGPIDLGIATPQDGRFLLRAEWTGRNPQASGGGALLGLDCIILSQP